MRAGFYGTIAFLWDISVLAKHLHLPLLLLGSALLLVLTACSTTSAQNELPEQSWYVDAVSFNRGAHAGLDCTECHGNISMKDVPDNHPKTDNLTQDAITSFDYSACERCHPQEYAAYQTGEHALVREGKKENTSTYPAPVCGNCHTPHYETANRSRVELIAAQVEICGACHPEERESYLQNFHGKAAVNLADPSSAACTDCHGGHAVASLTKTENAVAACQNCHPDANANMAGFLIHAQERLPAADARRATESTVLFYAKVFFTLLIVGTLGFFYAHTLLWLIRSAHKKMRGQ